MYASRDSIDHSKFSCSLIKTNILNLESINRGHGHVHDRVLGGHHAGRPELEVGLAEEAHRPRQAPR